MTPENLKQQRLKLGLSQDGLAKALGVTTTTVARWERGEQTIASPEMLELALEALQHRLQESRKVEKVKLRNKQASFTSSSNNADFKLRLQHRERALYLCQHAKELEEAGNYDAARGAMGNLWQRVGERPILDGLDERAAAEVLLRAGALTGWIGSARQIEGSQEAAKDLISESAAIFEKLEVTEKFAEAQIELAYCYWREGAYDESRITLRDALRRLGDRGGDIKALALLRSAIVETSAKRLHDSLHILTDGAPLFDASTNHSLKGRYYNELATTLKNIGLSEGRDEYTDRALVEYAAASFHFEQAGHKRYLSRVENNLGFLLFKLGRFPEAHEHLDRARRICVSLKDRGTLAIIDDTRARALLAEERNSEAEAVIKASVRALEKGGEQALLAESLTTYGVAQARLKLNAKAQATLEQAAEVAEQAGDHEGAGRALLSLIEELGVLLSHEDFTDLYGRAALILSDSQNQEVLARLRQCAR